ncbi:MAG TPA: nucleotide exchange factor GrpE [Solirubrobacteraceae bacterium]|jgi:molecular chaperone GrpE
MSDRTQPGGAGAPRHPHPARTKPHASPPDEAASVANGAAAEAADAAPLEAAEVEVDELAATAAQRDEYLALAQRTQADFENYRKRATREAGAAEERGLARLARELLPALDNLDRALDHAAESAADETLLDGLRLVRRELLGALERVGISAYGEAGERFDPELHEAVAQQPADGCEPGQIVGVYQAGYRSERSGVIRPARVLVAG